jgi:hypothetical protein
MDAAQMLTAREIARQCEQLAHAARQREAAATAPVPRRNLRVVESAVDRTAGETATAADERVPAEPPEEPLAAEEDVLTDRERGILAFERQWWKRQGTKERAIRELFDMSVSRYYQILNALLDKPAALRADPMLIKRLRKVRAARQHARTAPQPGIE